MPSAVRESEFAAVVRCQCGEDNVHLESVSVLQDRALTVITSAGATHDEAPASSGRGSIVEVRFACESGHRFARRYRFHKGKTYLDDVPRPDWEDGQFPATLWRD